jgi:hypothetical protein
MIRNELRVGNFTSSEIVALMTTGKQANGFGAAAITYIAETNMERLLERSLTDETNARPLAWGTLLEPRVFDLLGIDYTYSSNVTDVHPLIKYWAGSKDGTREGEKRAVIDIKCPMTLKSFVGLVLPLSFGFIGNRAMEAIRDGFKFNGIDYPKHKDAEKFYWQIVSNACINDCNYGELIVYMPYQSELLDIKKLADGNPSVYWLNFATEDEIPYIKDGGLFKNLNVIRFEIPETDKHLLRQNVLKGGTMLINRKVNEPVEETAQ